MPNNKNSSDFVSSTIHEIKKTFRHEPHSLSLIRATLLEDKNTESGLVDLLEKHHDYIKESIVILMDKEAKEIEKQTHLERFLHLLNMHGKAEEETLYQGMIKNSEKEARLEGIGGKAEHDHAFEISKELQALNFNIKWTEEIEAKAKVLAGLVNNHIKEEESIMFPIVKKDINEQVLKTLCTEYLSKCSTYINESLGAPRLSETNVVYH